MEFNNKTAAMIGAEKAFPFLDRDLLSFLMATPGEMIEWQSTPRAILRVGLRGVVPERILERHDKADFTQRANAAVVSEHATVASLVGIDSLSAQLGYMDRHGAETVIGDALRTAADGTTSTLGASVTDLAALELWLRTFFTVNGSYKETEYAIAH